MLSVLMITCELHKGCMELDRWIQDHGSKVSLVVVRPCFEHDLPSLYSLVHEASGQVASHSCIITCKSDHTTVCQNCFRCDCNLISQTQDETRLFVSVENISIGQVSAMFASMLFCSHCSIHWWEAHEGLHVWSQLEPCDCA